MRAVTLSYVLAAVVALVVFLAMSGTDARLRIGVAVGLFIGVAALATWAVVHVGDEARPGSGEVKSITAGQDSPASGPR